MSPYGELVRALGLAPVFRGFQTTPLAVRSLPWDALRSCGNHMGSSRAPGTHRREEGAAEGNRTRARQAQVQGKIAVKFGVLRGIRWPLEG